MASVENPVENARKLHSNEMNMFRMQGTVIYVTHNKILFCRNRLGIIHDGPDADAYQNAEITEMDSFQSTESFHFGILLAIIRHFTAYSSCDTVIINSWMRADSWEKLKNVKRERGCEGRG